MFESTYLLSVFSVFVEVPVINPQLKIQAGQELSTMRFVEESTESLIFPAVDSSCAMLTGERSCGASVFRSVGDWLL